MMTEERLENLGGEFARAKRCHRWLLFVIILFPLLMLIGQKPALCQEPGIPKIRIHLSVDGDDLYKNKVFGYIAGELSSLNDVLMVDQGGRFVIHCLVSVPKYVSGQNAGMVISTVILDNFDKDWIKSITSNCFKESDKERNELFNSAIESVSTYCNLLTIVGPEGDISNICRSIATSFNAMYLEPVRKTLSGQT